MERRRWSDQTFPATRTIWLVAALSTAACLDRDAIALPPHPQAGATVSFENDAPNKVDLLLEVDNSLSMAANQQHLQAQLPYLINALTNPGCTSVSNPTAHPCNASDPTDVPLPSVPDLHVAVISQDLGTAGVANSVCPGTGDNGVMNPILGNGPEQMHLTAQNMTDCESTNPLPTFLQFVSSSTDPNILATNFTCEATLGVQGCGLEQQLEAAWRALSGPNTADASSPNAGFLRDDALLAIVLLTDEEDGSVRDCNYAAPGQACNDAKEVWDESSTIWGGPTQGDLNIRLYDYQPGGAQDPTWPLERYVDPGDLSAGFLSLKPGHPEQVVFVAIAGVPTDSSTVLNADGTTMTNWDSLLGTPDPNDANNFYGRDPSGAYTATTPQGPVSMQPAQIDPNWTCFGAARVIPACRRPNDPTGWCMFGTPPADNVYFAWPSRRIVEVARRFDQSNLCNGQPCHNGAVFSICNDDYSPAMDLIANRIQSHLYGRCLPHPPMLVTNPSDNTSTARCTSIITLPVGTACTAIPGSSVALDANGQPQIDTEADGAHSQCTLREVPIDAQGLPVAGQSGWYYHVLPPGAVCAQDVELTPDVQLPMGASLSIECIEAAAPTAGSSM